MRTFADYCLRVAAFLVAVALIASQVIQNLEHLGWANAWSGIGLAAVAVPIALALAVPVMSHSWHERGYATAGVALMVVLCGLGHTSIVALERVSFARDQATAAKASTAHELATKAHETAIARVRELEALETKLCRTVGKDGFPTRDCVGAREQTSLARQRETEAQSALAKLGAPVETEGMARRYGIWATVIDTWHPLLLPLAVELGALVLIGFAFRCGKEEPQRLAVPLVAEEPAPQAAPLVPREKSVSRATINGPVAEGDVIAAFRPKRVA